MLLEGFRGWLKTLFSKILRPYLLTTGNHRLAVFPHVEDGSNNRKRRAECRLDDAGRNGSIAYVEGRSWGAFSGNAMNDVVYVHEADGGLRFRFSGMSFSIPTPNQHAGPVETAEYLWRRATERLAG